MTDLSQYSANPIRRRARFDAVLGRAAAIQAKCHDFFAKKENRIELRRLFLTFSILYILVGFFAVAVIGFVSTHLNFQ